MPSFTKILCLFLLKSRQIPLLSRLNTCAMQNHTLKERQTLVQVEKQEQVLRPLLQAEVRVLRMSQQEFEEDVRAHLDTNPALEEYDEETALGTGDATDDEGADFAQKDIYSQEDYDNDRINDYSPDDIPTYYDPDHTRERVIADQSSFYENLKEQVASCNLTPKQEQIMDYLIGSLDEDGFLRKSLRVLRDEMEIYYGIEASAQELEEVVKVLQGFEPVGIGAKDLQESLILQLRNMERANSLRDVAIEILSRGFEDYKNKRYEKLCARFGVCREELERVYSLVRRLNPRPGGAVAAADNVAMPVSPDFYVEEVDGNFNVGLCHSHVPSIKVSSAYAEYASTGDNGTSVEQEAVRRQVSEARLYVAAIRQRQHTMLDTMRAIVHLQSDFFRDGDRSLLHPMTQKDVADIIRRDPSTVSGVVSNKYADTPFGIIPLASLFTQSFVNQQGEEVSREAVRMKMRDLIEEEDPLHPLSDDELAEQLGIARRTVAKYRKQMRIPVARLRR